MSHSSSDLPEQVPIQGQDWFLRCVKALGLRSSETGLCMGYSYAAIPMILQIPDDKTILNTFNHRTLSIYKIYRKIYPDDSIPFDEEKFAIAFKEEIYKGQKARIKIADKAKKLSEEKMVLKLKNKLRLIGDYTLDQIFEIERNALEKELEEKFFGLSPDIIKKEKEKILINFRNALYQKFYEEMNKIIEHEIKQASSPEEKEILQRVDMQIFMEEVELLFHQKNEYPELYAKTISYDEALHQTFNYILPKRFEIRAKDEKIEDEKLAESTLQDPINQVADFIGIYNIVQLNTYFSSLHHILRENKLNEPIALVLKGVRHTITVGYEPIEKEWIFIDSNDLPVSAKRVKEDKEIAQYVFAAYGSIETAAFETKIYAHKNSEGVKEVIDLWKKTPEWQVLHEITPAKSQLMDATGNGLLYLAVEKGDLNLVRDLLAKGAKPDELTFDNFAPLDVAVFKDDAGIAGELIKHGAYFGFTHLVDAIDYSAKNVFKKLLLLDKGGNPNGRRSDGYTPLTLAAYRGDHDIVETLLADKRTDLTLTFDGYTPFVIAIYQKHNDLAVLISRAECKKMAAIKPNKNDSLFHRGAIQKLQEMAKKLEDEKDVDRLKELDKAFYIFNRLDQLSKTPMLIKMNDEARRKFKNDIEKGFKSLQQGKYSDAEKIIKHLIHLHSVTQLEELRKNISHLGSMPEAKTRSNALVQLQKQLLKTGKDLNEQTIENLKTAYEIFIKIDRLVYHPRDLFFSKKNNPQEEKFKQNVEEMYAEFSKVKDNNYEVVLYKLSKLKKVAIEKGFIKEHKPSVAPRF